MICEARRNLVRDLDEMAAKLETAIQKLQIMARAELLQDIERTRTLLTDLSSASNAEAFDRLNTMPATIDS